MDLDFNLDFNWNLISIKSNMDLISMNQRVSHKLFLLFMTHTFKAAGHPEGK